MERYTYDNHGSLARKTDCQTNQTTAYDYNDTGKLVRSAVYTGDTATQTPESRMQYTYTTSGNIGTLSYREKDDTTTRTYTYEYATDDRPTKATLPDKSVLTYSYDSLRRPTNYLGRTMAWDNTGSLTAIGNTSNGTIRYTYLSDGQRHTKTINGKTTTYRYNNGMLLSEQTGDETLRYYYDAAGKVASLTYIKGSNAEVSYFYARNLQGDIIAIYRSSDSKLIGTYEYDLWGRPVSVTEATKGIDTNGILTKNPFRYRGYYYDPETGFYYLNARYYDPEVRRFISADDMEYLGVGDGISGYNLFAYCGNNPVMGYDPTGTGAVLLWEQAL